VPILSGPPIWDESAVRPGRIRSKGETNWQRSWPPIVRQLAWAATPATLGHFRDPSSVEVDLVLEHADGRVAGIEVKATGTPRAGNLRGLRFLADRLGSRFAYGCLLSMAAEPPPFGPRPAALPISSLWDPIE
jgi:hypothetical protein